VTRSLSTQALISTREQHTNEAWLVCIELVINGTAHYVVNNDSDITSNGQLYTAYPFELTLAGDTLEDVPNVSVTIDNVDRMLVDALRASVKPPEFTIRVILSSQPDTVEFELTELKMVEVAVSDRAISASLTLDDVFTAAFGEQYDPAQAPGLF